MSVLLFPLPCRPSARKSLAAAAGAALLFLVSGHSFASEGAAALPVVAAVPVLRQEMSQEVSFEAELRPYQEIELHARVTGYLDAISVDAGDIVKEGQTLATIDVPELKNEIDHALAVARRSKAETARAAAAYEDTHLSFTRITAVDKAKPNLIAQQDIDEARAKDRVAAAALDAAKQTEDVAEADIKKYRIMEEFTKITAPFNGVITKRYSDPGALIQAGTSTGSMPLVRLSENDKLRAVFPVSVSYVSGIKMDAPVKIHIDSTLNRTISGKVARFSRKVETATRTMEVEVDVPNTDLALTPGMYATAMLRTELRPGALSVPIEAVARGKTGTATVYVINKDNKIEERQVKVGLETPHRIEIVSGVAESDLVMTSNRALVKPGEVVEAKVTEPVKPVVEGVPQTAKAN